MNSVRAVLEAMARSQGDWRASDRRGLLSVHGRHLASVRSTAVSDWMNRSVTSTSYRTVTSSTVNDRTRDSSNGCPCADSSESAPFLWWVIGCSLRCAAAGLPNTCRYDRHPHVSRRAHRRGARPPRPMQWSASRIRIPSRAPYKRKQHVANSNVLCPHPANSGYFLSSRVEYAERTAEVSQVRYHFREVLFSDGRPRYRSVMAAGQILRKPDQQSILRRTAADANDDRLQRDHRSSPHKLDVPDGSHQNSIRNGGFSPVL